MNSTDIVSADIASNRDYLTAAIRVSDLNARYMENPGLIGMSVHFTLGANRFGLSGSSAASRSTPYTTNDDFTVWKQVGGDVGTERWGWVGYASGMFSDDESVVYVTTPMKQLRAKPGMKATDLRASAGYGVDALVVAQSVRADYAVSERNYILGAASCSPVPINPCPTPGPQRECTPQR